MPLASTEDQPRCCFLAEDITARRRRETEIAQDRRLRAIGELVGGIAHEFNNLLTPILASADHLASEWAHLAGVPEETRLITEAARRAAELTHRLLAFGRKTERRAERIALRQVVEANVDLIRHTTDRRIQISTTMRDSLPPLVLPAGDLHQILLNLLLNARQTLDEKLRGAPPAGWRPEIRIEVAALPAAAAAPIDPGRPRPDAGWIRLTVSDTGLGMPAAVRERVFEPFFTTKDVGQGTGLGLATVWHLVSEFGGRVEVESTAGEGSAFHLYLPATTRPEPAAAAPALPPQPFNHTAMPPLHFLLVEDEPAVARVVTAFLARRKHRVTHYANGAEAWERFAADPAGFDTVIMDLNMPGLDGVELAGRIRALPVRKPLVIISGRITEEQRTALNALEVDAVVNKPFTLDEITAALDRIFRRPPPDGSPGNPA